ncbi:XK-related protein 6-like [Saccostrea echinata]|uniref:XK-related protein 6-like n=1 Tax=Saccostrea echinata TaxID=191078 RepID=UPI002A81B779|nr:XK-related protein 6-like [Saccostrea echinata]
MKELKSKKKQETGNKDEVDNMVGFRAKQMNQGEKDNLIGQHKSYPAVDPVDCVDVGEKSRENGESDQSRREIMLRNMVGLRDENITLIDNSGDNTAIDDKNNIQIYPFTILDFLGVVVSIVLFVFDVVTDILLAMEYKNHGRMVECALTSSVVVASFLVAGSLSTVWYLQDGSGPVGKVGKFLFLVVAFPFSTIIRNFSYLKHGFLSRRSTDKKKHYNRMIKNDIDASFLRMFDAFFESAPQLIIQVYIAIHDTPQEELHLQILRAVTIASSLAGLAWSVTGYNRALRIFNATSGLKANTYCGAVGYFLWRVFEIGPRITAIVMLISIEGNGPYYVIFGVLFHWMVMITVAFFKNVKAYKRTLHNILFIVFIGFVQIISFMNLSRDKSRVLAIAYYSLFHVENAVMVALFVFWGDVDKSSWVYIATISVASSGVVLCTLFMIMYYTLCHPKVSRTCTCNHNEEMQNVYKPSDNV